MKPILGSYLTLALIYLVGVIFFFQPIAEGDSARGPLVPPLIGFLVSTVLYIALFAWIAREMRSGLRAALAVALSQLLLVDVDYVLTGDRGVATAAASSVLLLVAWSMTGWVYDRMSDDVPI
jgi:biotin transporter BioY